MRLAATALEQRARDACALALEDGLMGSGGRILVGRGGGLLGLGGHGGGPYQTITIR